MQDSVHTCVQSVSSSQMAKVSMFLTVPQTWIELSIPGTCVTCVYGCTKMLQNRLDWCPNPSLGGPPGAHLPPITHTRSHEPRISFFFWFWGWFSQISNWNISRTEPLNVLLLFFFFIYHGPRHHFSKNSQKDCCDNQTDRSFRLIS